MIHGDVMMIDGDFILIHEDCMMIDRAFMMTNGHVHGD